MRMWVPSLASLSGLRIHRCHERWYKSATAGPIQPLAWELPYATGMALKNKKQRRSPIRCHVGFQGMHLGTKDAVRFSRWYGEARREEGRQGRGASPLPVRDPDKWRPSLRCRGTSLPGSRQTRSHPGTRVGRDRGRGEEGLVSVKGSRKSASPPRKDYFGVRSFSGAGRSRQEGSRAFCPPPPAPFPGSLGSQCKRKGCLFQRRPPGGSKKQQAGKRPHLQDVSSQVLLEDLRDQRHGAPAAWGGRGRGEAGSCWFDPWPSGQALRLHISLPPSPVTILGRPWMLSGRGLGFGQRWGEHTERN